MLKKTKKVYGGMIKDVSNTQTPETSYFDATYGRTTATKSSSDFSFTNEKGNKEYLKIPSITVDTKGNVIQDTVIYNTKLNLKEGVYSEFIVCGSVTTTDGLVLITAGRNQDNQLLNIVWIYNEGVLKLLNANHFDILETDYVTMIANYETELIEKIYWVDGKHQIRFLNIRQSVANGDREEIYQLPLSMIEAVAPYNISPIVVEKSTTGGNHTAGVIQYAYTLYKINGSESKMSALTPIIALTNSDGGGKPGEKVTTVPIITIDNIDNTFDNIKVYSIKYTELNGTPTVGVVTDVKIPENLKLTVRDYGDLLYTITPEELVLKSLTVYIPSDIETKENRLFVANYLEKPFKFTADMRAFSFNSAGICKIHHNANSFTDIEKTTTFTRNDLPKNNNEKHDSINLNFDEFKYGTSNKAIGGMGRNCEYTLSTISINDGISKFFKDEEIYRLGIVFYNKYGATCEPLWIADFKTPVGNLEGRYNILDFKLTTEFITQINNIEDDYFKPYGYKILVANRTSEDSSIIASGIISSMFVNYGGSNNKKFNIESVAEEESKISAKRPNPLIRVLGPTTGDVISSVKPLNQYHNFFPMNYRDDDPLIVRRYNIPEMQSNNKQYGGSSWQYNYMYQLFSPELLFAKTGVSIPNGCKFRRKALLKNIYNSFWSKEIEIPLNAGSVDVKGYEGLQPWFTKYNESAGDATKALDTGLIGHPSGSEPDMYTRTLWNRVFGKNPVIKGMDNKYNYDEGGAVIPITTDSLQIMDKSTISPAVPEDLINDVETLLNGETIIKTTVKPIIKRLQRAFIHVYYVPAVPTNNTYTVIMKGSYDEPEETFYTTKSSVLSSGRAYAALPVIPDIPNPVGDLDYNFGFKVIVKSSDINEQLKGSISVKIGLFGSDNELTANNIRTNEISGEFSFDIPPYTEYEDLEQYVPFPQESFKNTHYDIYGTAEFTKKGQSYVNYNNNSAYRYTNTLVGTKTDGNGSWQHMGTFGRRLTSVNTDASNCITFVPSRLGNDIDAPVAYETLSVNPNKLDYSGMVLYGEVVRDEFSIYFGGLYGGNRYEDKLRTIYNEVDELILLPTTNTTSVQRFTSPGDVYVQLFKFLRMVTKDDSVNQGMCQMEELVSYPTETTINLDNRSDDSRMEWDAKLKYSNDEYHNYNPVYSKTDGFIQHKASEYYVKDTDTYNSSIIPSKQKSAGEIVDSWFSPLINDKLTLDGKYGPIRKMVNFNDEIYVWQDKALSQLSVSPRIQLTTEDSAGLELGTGQVLPRYINVSQSTGTINKHSIIKSPYGVYYYDDINQQICVFNGQVAPISETGGLHSYIQNYPLKELETANPRFFGGVISGYDPINKDVHMSFNFNNYTDTLIFNEKRNMFISRRDERVSSYITHNSEFLTSKDNKTLFKEGVGEFNIFYNKEKPTTITFVINPEVDLDTILDVIDFKSEVYKNKIDQPSKTITSYRAYNEFQDTGIIPVIEGRRGNARRYLRDWNISIGRNKGTRERIRNEWNYLELTFNNSENLELILHDIIVSYTI